jgi:hypothetical protein
LIDIGNSDAMAFQDDQIDYRYLQGILKIFWGRRLAEM